MLEVIILLIIAVIMNRSKEKPTLPYSGPSMYYPAVEREYAKMRKEMMQWRLERTSKRIKWTCRII